jgi:hypothetical protein
MTAGWWETQAWVVGLVRGVAMDRWVERNLGGVDQADQVGGRSHADAQQKGQLGQDFLRQ